MARKYTKRRTYYRRGFRRYKRVQENYFRVKAEINGQIRFPVNPGQPMFYLTNAGLDAPRTHLTFSYIINKQTFAQMLSGMFSFYKIMALSYECTPLAQNTNGVRNITTEPCTVLACRAGNDDALNFGEARSINSAMVMNPVQFQRKYNSLLGFYTNWFATNSAPTGTVTIVAENDTGALLVSPEWNFKITMYMMYKKSKV